ncbi:thiolase family protein [Pseudomaricurvus alkylphenolicus]|jgi:acetyl-CoA acetyltransferase|uniref:thiolase family protein n=1 Tax=Pseudomaricurvus alkylphenolicus TaxID=1306991 RepID=UPI001423E91E|nr:thiolase family protein [Pseudomaricurvus alkylphenolicus]NIB41009.1 thiolase family protein [Pseudomaricurvus alkylphenolicus]
MGLKGNAAIVGFAQYKPEKYATAPRAFHLDQVAELTRLAIADAGLEAKDINGLAVNGPWFNEAASFVPASVAEYLGTELNFAEVVDLGGAGSVAMAWRAAAAIELGLADVVVCTIPQRMAPMAPDADPLAAAASMRYGGHSTLYGAPEAEFDIPYGHMAQNTGYAMIAKRYADQYGYDERAMAKIAVDQRINALANPDALFFGQPISIEDVLASKMVADPLHMLEIVMPVAGGGAFVVASREVAQRLNKRPAWITGCGERLTTKSPSYTTNMLATPIGPASEKAFNMASVRPSDVDLACIYDCYTITVLLSLEDAGFCGKGEGMGFVADNDLTYKGNFPVNTHGGQLSFGQAGTAGGMSQLIEGATQIMGSAGERQLQTCNTVYVSGTGGVMSEQTALILQGD